MVDDGRLKEEKLLSIMSEGAYAYVAPLLDGVHIFGAWIDVIYFIYKTMGLDNILLIHNKRIHNLLIFSDVIDQLK